MSYPKHKLSLFEFEIDNKKTYKIYHNLPDMIEAALINWEVRTTVHTAKSFCDYINSKRERGLTDHYAYTEEEFNNLK